MKEVAFDLPKFYPPVEPPPFASGEVCRKSKLLLRWIEIFFEMLSLLCV
jgi:hypothetical protein